METVVRVNLSRIFTESYKSSILVDLYVRTLNDFFPWQCDPYFDNSGCSHPGCEPRYPTPVCQRKCVKENLIWWESKQFSANAYRIDSDPYNIMAEVYSNGPAEAAFTVYEVKRK